MNNQNMQGKNMPANIKILIKHLKLYLQNSLIVDMVEQNIDAVQDKYNIQLYFVQALEVYLDK
jgi:hypothetical protein